MSQYALIVVDGKYRNEVTGKPTTTSICLQAYTDVLSRKNANVNLLTQLEMNRVYYLVTQKKKRFKVAKHQAQMEILDAFYIDTTGINKSSEDLNVFGNTEADAALLAISIMLQGDSSETALSVLLTEIADDMESDGKWDDSVTKARIAEWAVMADTAGKLAKFRSHAQDWGLSNGKLPDFEKFIRIFWGKELGLGVCGEGENKVGTVKNVSNPNSTKYYAKEYFDTTSAGGKIRFICVDADSAKWRVATDIEKDTYKKPCTKDGILFSGNITDSVYVCDAGKFRYANDTEIAWNRGCVNDIYGTSVMFNGQCSYYVCTANGWIPDVKRNSGTMKDSTGTEYKTITIANQVWMVENLNYEIEGQSLCYNNSADSCAKYGRLYTWAAAVGKTEEECGLDKRCGLTGTIRGICPKGWHLPSSDEWSTLYSAIGSNPYALQAKGFANWPNATDAYGFSALPAGGNYRSGFSNVGSVAIFWSSTESNNNYAFYWNLSEHNAAKYSTHKDLYFPVRCVMDTPVVP